MADSFRVNKYREEVQHNQQLLETINEMITDIRKVCTDWACNTQSAVLSVQMSFPAEPRGEHAH